MIKLAVNASFTASGDDADNLALLTDGIMGELVDLADSDPNMDDPAISLDLVEESVLFELTARGEDFDAAWSHALACLRSAIHAAGGATPGWENLIGPTPTRTGSELISA
jgi:hypothetical protein